jgi:hypothetical protein
MAAIAAAFATPAAAAETDWGGDIEVMAEGEMNELRGGFEVPGTNVNINFGAVVTTYVNREIHRTTSVVRPASVNQHVWREANKIGRSRNRSSVGFQHIVVDTTILVHCQQPVAP